MHLCTLYITEVLGFLVERLQTHMCRHCCHHYCSWLSISSKIKCPIFIGSPSPSSHSNNPDGPPWRDSILVAAVLAAASWCNRTRVNQEPDTWTYPFWSPIVGSEFERRPTHGRHVSRSLRVWSNYCSNILNRLGRHVFSEAIQPPRAQVRTYGLQCAAVIDMCAYACTAVTLYSVPH